MKQIFELAGYRICVNAEGTGKPLLLLHSYWGSHLLFDQLAAEFSVKRRVIRIDLPGHGNSGMPPADYTFDKFSMVLLELLNKLQVYEKVSVIGHSMGGYVAMAFAARYPERIASLVLMHSPLKAADLQSIKLREREARMLMKGKRELLLQAMIPSNFAPGHASLMGDTFAMLEKLSREVTLEGALGSIYAINHRDNALAAMQSAPYPILIVIGKYDKVYSAQEQLEEASLVPAARVLLLKHAGHLGFIEEKELVFKEVGDFVDKND